LLCLSCLSIFSYAQAVYQVASMQSDQVKLVENDFVYENEHLKVIYNFWEEGGRMRFMLYNKTDQPIYIDWSKSFIERNGFVTVYSQLLESTGNVPADVGQYVYQKAGVQPLRRTARTNGIAQIPPHMYAAIADFLINHVQEQTYPAGDIATYTKENSPLRLQHQLAYSFNGALIETQLIKHSFWAESIYAIGRADITRLYGSLQYGQPNALYALRDQPYEPVSNYKRSRGDRVVSHVLLGILSVVIYIVTTLRR
jgi:hypothetical protein